MTEPVTKRIHCRLTCEGTLYAVSSDEIENGTSLDDASDGTEPFRDFVIAVTARPPPPDQPAVAAVDVPDEAPPEVTATAQATAA